MKRIIERKVYKRLYVRLGLYGKGVMCFVPSQGFYYDHDKIFDLILENGRSHKALLEDGHYSSKIVPTFCKDNVYSL